MDITKVISDNQSYITIGLGAAIIMLLLISIVLLKALRNLELKYRRFMRGVKGTDIETLVLGYFDKIDEVKKDTAETKEKSIELEKELQKCIQKTSILRYRAFENVGSDLSFSIALLDNNNDGFILTGIYGRNDSTTYAKPIDKGLSRYDMSDEEKEVLNKAMNKE